eukprot:10100715-Karenia_brevis.AAC.1
MRQLGFVTRCDQLQRSHLSLGEGWAVATRGAIAQWDATVWVRHLMSSVSTQPSQYVRKGGQWRFCRSM